MKWGKINIMNIDRIKELFYQLQNYLKRYGDTSIRNQCRIVDDTIAVLSSNESDEYKFNYTLQSYKALFTGKGGLTDFYAWDDDFNKRLRINEPYEKITDELWNIFKNYI